MIQQIKFPEQKMLPFPNQGYVNSHFLFRDLFIMEKEAWVDVRGYNGKYKISNLGNLKSFHRNKEGKINAFEIDKTGYKRIKLYLNKKGNHFFIHRLIAIAFIPNPENKPFINHKDGNKLNNSIENIEWCTPKENAQHAMDTGLNSNIGENHAHAKLKNKDVLFIRNEYNNSDNKVKITKDLSLMFSVHYAIIRGIVTRKQWKHI